MKTRLAPETFEFPLAEIRRGYRSAIYFNRTKQIIQNHPELMFPAATMQVFQKNDAILCGIDEAIAMIQQCVGYWSDEAEAHQVFDDYMVAKMHARKNPLNSDAALLVLSLERLLDEMWINTSDEVTIEALHDGDAIFPWEPVMRITGDYSYFAHLESVYLGILARATKIATNVRKTCQAAGDKQVLFFADRFDRWANQAADGYAASIGGATGFASDAMGSWWGEPGIGTMPHALIAMLKGDVAEATALFHEDYPEVNTVALVDFNNECVEDTLQTAYLLRDKLWGVRLDTSESLVDPAVQDSDDYGKYKPTGVNPMLVKAVRDALDERGFEHVKIIVSGGFNPDKIQFFEDLKVPVDVYAVGSSLLAGSNDFTADIVSPSVKFGRKEQDYSRLEVVGK